MSDLIEVEDLVKVYPDGTKAVDEVSFDVSTGEIFGFLGPNGAGKTTIIRILVTLLPKTSGSARIDGVEVDDDPEAVRKMIGYAAQFIGVDDDLTGRENLILQGRLHGMGRLDSQRRAGELLEVFSLREAADKRVGAFSGGMRRRLDLAQALVHRPALLFLDETTIFLTTQYMEEADRMSHRLAIIDHGTVIVSDSPASLKQEIGGDVITLTLPDDAG